MLLKACLTLLAKEMQHGSQTCYAMLLLQPYIVALLQFPNSNQEINNAVSFCPSVTVSEPTAIAVAGDQLPPQQLIVYMQ